MTDAHHPSDEGTPTERRPGPAGHVAELTAFQRDVCWVLASEGPAAVAILQAALTAYYGFDVGRNRLAATVGELADGDLVDRRRHADGTARFRLTTAGRRTLSRRQIWLQRQCRDKWR